MWYEGIILGLSIVSLYHQRLQLRLFSQVCLKIVQKGMNRRLETGSPENTASFGIELFGLVQSGNPTERAARPLAFQG